MRKRSRLWYYAVGILLVLSVVGICLEIFESGTVGDVTPFIVSMISLIVAVLAFDISLKTYSSIDAVNSMTRMDGNIMENKDYQTNLFALLKEFPQTDMVGSRISMMSRLTDLFSPVKIVSGAKLADSIQQLIDYMIFFPYYVNASDKKFAVDSRAEVNKLLSIIELNVKEYDKMSEGSSVLLDENLKLIKAIFDVQLKRSECQSCSGVNILEVRGSMMRNPVSQTMFYDYAGLFYLSKALDLMAECLGCKSRDDLYTIQRIKELGMIEPVDRIKITDYLSMAESKFIKALDIMTEDVMWNGMIYFNIARVKFFDNVLNGLGTSEWKTSMNSAVYYRAKFNDYLSDVLPDYKDACLISAFSAEESYARLTKIVFELALGDPLTDEYGELYCQSGRYSDVFDIPVVKQFGISGKDDFKLLSAPYKEIVDAMKPQEL